ncbi:MAG: hypothetical protein JOZ87_42195 [Chloroflexi bacterium]|nr:hypothetical protein [Chloroflexota bacterium]
MTGSTLARFTQQEGASYHCQPLARELTEQRMFDWLDEHIARCIAQPPGTGRLQWTRDELAELGRFSPQ